MAQSTSIGASNRIQINANHASSRADLPQGYDGVEPSPAPEIEDSFPWLQIAPLVRAAEGSVMTRLLLVVPDCQ